MSFLKHVIISFLASVLLFETVTGKVYPDVPTNHKHHNAIAALTDSEIIQGYPNGTFQPENLINRAEAIKILAKSKYPASQIDSALEWHKKANHTFVMFPDIPIKEWYSK